jgi:hypothetical protein
MQAGEFDCGVRKIYACGVPALACKPDDVSAYAATNIQRPSGREAAIVLNQQLVWVGVGFDGSRPNLVPEFSSVGGLVFSLSERAR